MASIDSLTLETILCLCGTPTRTWGMGEAKSSEDLAREISQGESHLRIDADGLVRVLRIARFSITHNSHGGLFLLEDFQVLPDGRRRSRNQRPAGKIGTHETPHEAAYRELKEELELKTCDFRIVPQGVVIEKRESTSFPGLTAVYEIHNFSVHLNFFIAINDGHCVLDAKSGVKLFFRWGLE